MERVDIGALGFEELIDREWLSPNGLGGYASSTVCGMNTRKYHGLLVAAMSPPVRRMVILSRVDETVITDIGPFDLSSNEYPGAIHPQGYTHLRAFNADPFPRWAYQADGFTLEKSVRLLRGENFVCLSYTLLAGDRSVELELRPLLALRGIHELMFQWNRRLRAESMGPGRHRVAATARTPEVFFAHDGEFTNAPVWYLNTIYRREQQRGYAGLEDLWMPGIIRRRLSPGQTMHFVCGMEPIELDRIIGQLNRLPVAAPLPAPQAQGDATLVELTRAASIYVVQGDQPASGKSTAIITHYPWSSPSVRGALISLAGLLLAPARYDEARSLLESCAAMADIGVLPSELPEDGGKPIYQGADVSLWFINAVHQYFQYTGDEAAIRQLLPLMRTIVEKYRRGTHLGIVADADGLIVTGMPDRPTTWMDAMVGDWIVTPRRGRAVEINALWYNALRIVADFTGKFGDASPSSGTPGEGWGGGQHRESLLPERSPHHGPSPEYQGRREEAAELISLANSVQDAFNRRFWNASLNCLYDVVNDGASDAAVRPNQIFAISLPYPVLTPDRHAAVIDMIVSELLTPRGVRTLSPRDPAYEGRYAGNVISRDRAYQQGSAYPWLLGPLVTATLKTRGRTEPTLAYARQLLHPSINYMRNKGLGLIRELFDGDAPNTPGGALASAPAAAELLRCWSEDILAISPPRRQQVGESAVSTEPLTGSKGR